MILLKYIFVFASLVCLEINLVTSQPGNAYKRPIVRDPQRPRSETTTESFEHENKANYELEGEHSSMKAGSRTTLITEKINAITDMLKKSIEALSSLAAMVNPDTEEVTKTPSVAQNMRLQSIKECGVSKSMSCGRLPVARIAKIDEYPWNAIIMQKGLSGFEIKCGGVIVDEQWIVTAAHCLKNVEPQDLEVVVGTNDLSKIDETLKFKVTKIIKHEEFKEDSPRELANDIALLHLSESIDLKSSDSLNSICLPQSGEKFERMVELAAWGRIRTLDDENSLLRTGGVFIYSDHNCKKSYRDLFNEEAMICAGLRKGKMNTCEAFSGGPIIKRKEGKAYLAGLLSFDVGCNKRGHPAVYTRVSNYVDWIQNHMYTP